MRRRALEIHVLQQVRHAGLAVALMARSDFVGDIDADRATRLIGIEQDLQAVRQPVFGDPLDAAHLLRG